MKRRGGAGLHSISSPDGEVNQAGPVPASTLSATPVAETHCSALDGGGVTDQVLGSRLQRAASWSGAGTVAQPARPQIRTGARRRCSLVTCNGILRLTLEFSGRQPRRDFCARKRRAVVGCPLQRFVRPHLFSVTTRS